MLMNLKDGRPNPVASPNAPDDLPINEQFVWVTVYAAVVNDPNVTRPSTAARHADEAVAEFKKRFSQ